MFWITLYFPSQSVGLCVDDFDFDDSPKHLEYVISF